MIYKHLKLLAAVCCLQITASAQSTNIKLNQLGFYPNAPKIAIVTNAKAGKFSVVNNKGARVFSSTLVQSAQPSFSGKYTLIADFSALTTPGRYFLVIPETGKSYTFDIKPAVYKAIADATVEAFYFQRASTPLIAKYAGRWQREEGHPDNKVMVHPSAADDRRPAGTVISSPRGWYDAGDFNKYIVNSGISTATLLSLCEDYPAYVKTVKLKIPESKNELPDILDEVLWNLRWMLTMQDPNDGGVYHKLTNASFDGMVMPNKALTTRYVVQKSTAATLDFAAVMAQASRVFKQYPKQLPGLADSCLRAAEYAWQWAVKNPDIIYNQDELNKHYSPKITTGAYGDGDVSDEWFWAAAELLTTTGKDEYYDRLALKKSSKISVPATWGQVKLLGVYTLAQHGALIGANYPAITEMKDLLISFADMMIDGAHSDAYQTVMTKATAKFNWGSNSDAANEGILLIKAYKLTGNKNYLKYALSNLDYILGRNAAGYCYVTGFGYKSPMHPHHRPSVADGVNEPVPGLLVGGANPGMQDGVKLASTVPDEAYIDDDRSYATNEIAINWNAPIAYLANAMEALQKQLAVK